MSSSRATAPAALLVCSVVSSRWPVSAACTAMSAVSRSRISPTMMTSGSWRRIERRTRAKSSSISGLTWIWVMPSIWYSIGSSMVMILSLAVVEVAQGGVERRGLAAAGGAGDQDHAVRRGQRVAQLGLEVGPQAEVGGSRRPVQSGPGCG